MMLRFLSFLTTMILVSLCSSLGNLNDDKDDTTLATPTITLNHSLIDTISAEGGSVVIEFEASHEWVIATRYPGTDYGWCDVNGTSGNAGKCQTEITVSDNDRSTFRSVEIVIYATNVSKTMEKAVKIVQRPMGETPQEQVVLSLSISADYRGPDFLFDIVDVTNNSASSVNAEIGVLVSTSSAMTNPVSGTAGFIDILPGETRQCEVTVSNLAKNSDFYIQPYAKIGEKTYVGEKKSVRTDPLTFYISESNDEYSFGEQEQTLSLHLVSNVPFEDPVISESWISIKEYTFEHYRRYNNYTFKIDANSSDLDRTATITFASSKYGVSKVIKVKQAKKVATTGETDGHAWVNLALPSGTLWATMNVGASKAVEYGRYYAWGETIILGEEDKDNAHSYFHYESYVKQYYNSESYKYFYCEVGQFTHANLISKYGKSDGLNELESSDDAATKEWGEKWTMPTNEQVRELVNETHYVWTENYNDSGVKGGIFYRKKSDGNYTSSDPHIFIPASGYAEYKETGKDAGDYGVIRTKSLESTVSSSNPYYTVWNLMIKSNEAEVVSGGRTFGYATRAVVK